MNVNVSVLGSGNVKAAVSLDGGEPRARNIVQLASVLAVPPGTAGIFPLKWKLPGKALPVLLIQNSASMSG